MTQAELIKKIKGLQEIRPRKDWASLTKSQILGTEKPVFSPFLILKPAYAGLVVVFILFGVFGVAQNSLPGDLLYSIKKITEKGQAVFVSEEQKPAFQLKLVNERLEDLTKAPVKNLAPALNEFQANLSEAAKNLTATEKPDVKGIVKETKKLEENKQKVEALGIVVGETEELDSALSKLVEKEIADLEGRTLTEEQKSLLAEAKEDCQAGDYTQALEKILILSNQ